MDNGFASFNQIRIPRMDMLMGFAQVSSSGVYTKQVGAEKIAYGIMLDVRARICINSAYVLARALTISIRYSCVRVQGFIDNVGKSPVEYSVIEYPTQQRVLMPLLAMSYALHFTGLDVKQSYSKYVATGDSTLLSELHASSAGLKAYITTHVSEGMESCRKMCGGHGFLVNAGFADLYTSYLPFSTLEGTKEVLQQQMGRFLAKQYIAAISSIKTKEKERTVLSSSTAYLADLLLAKKKKIMDIKSLLVFVRSSFYGISDADFGLIEEFLFHAHRVRAAWMISIAAAAIHAATKEAKVVNKKVSFSSSSNSIASLPKLPTTLYSSLFRNRSAKSPNVSMGGFESQSPQNGRIQTQMTTVQDPLLLASVELCEAAEAHSELLILNSFSSGIRSQMEGSAESSSGNRGTSTYSDTRAVDLSITESPLGDAEIQALRTMFVLLGINMMGSSSGQFLASGAIEVADLPTIGTEYCHTFDTVHTVQ